MKKILIGIAIALLVLVAILVARFLLGGSEDDWICQDGQWVEHGHPRAPMPTGVCRQPEIETCQGSDGQLIALNEAQDICYQQLTGQGSLADNHSCNSYTGTWWIDFLPNDPHEGCSPACVVNIASRSAEINWRCTGLRH